MLLRCVEAIEARHQAGMQHIDSAYLYAACSFTAHLCNKSAECMAEIVVALQDLACCKTAHMEDNMLSAGLNVITLSLGMS